MPEGLTHEFLQQPLAFVATGGQAERQAPFTARGPGYEVEVGSAGATMTLLAGDQPAVMHIAPVGGQPPAAVRALDELPGRFNDHRGADPGRWRTDLPTYAKVSLEEVYPGIDLMYYGNQQRLEYDYVVDPGADPDVIELAFGGSEPPELEPDGSLLLSTPGGQVRQLPPLAYQERGGERVVVPSGYAVSGDRVSFRLGTYDPSRTLVIDPILAYSSYLGGSGADKGFGVAVDGDATYVTGQTSSVDFPTTPGLNTNLNGTSDAFVTKLGPSGVVEYSTYLGGGGDDQALGIAVVDGRAFVTGQTLSSDFPTTPGLDNKLGGTSDAFVTKLEAGGTVDFSTYLRGTGEDVGHGVAVDGAGRAFVTGQTLSSDFPTTPGLDTKLGGTSDAFVTKLGAGGSVDFSTYLGGSDHDQGFGLAVDSRKRPHVTGQTLSGDFPTTPRLDTKLGGNSDAFVTKLSSTGIVDYSTFLGGTGSDQGTAIALDTKGRAHVTGQTLSSDFPTKGGPDASFDGPSDTFVSKLRARGTLMYSTFLGGTGGELGVGIAVDVAGAAYVTGQTASADYPTTQGLDRTFGGGIVDSFLTKLAP